MVFKQGRTDRVDGERPPPGRNFFTQQLGIFTFLVRQSWEKLWKYPFRNLQNTTINVIHQFSRLWLLMFYNHKVIKIDFIASKLPISEKVSGSLLSSLMNNPLNFLHLSAPLIYVSLIISCLFNFSAVFSSHFFFFPKQL